MSGRTTSGVFNTRETVPIATSAARATSTIVGGEDGLGTEKGGQRDFAPVILDWFQPVPRALAAQSFLSARSERTKANVGARWGSPWQRATLDRLMKGSNQFPVFHRTFHASSRVKPRAKPGNSETRIISRRSSQRHVGFRPELLANSQMCGCGRRPCAVRSANVLRPPTVWAESIRLPDRTKRSTSVCPCRSPASWRE
jgi:hypothetical protein